MSPVSSVKDRQFAFVLRAEEHEMLTKLADAAEVSAAEWLRETIRTAFQDGPLETLAQRISRVRDSFVVEHSGLVERMHLRMSKRLPPPDYPVLKHRLNDLRDLAKRTGAGGASLDAYVTKYEGALYRAVTRREEPACAEKELQEAFDNVWLLLDDWKERSRAEDARRP
jgi:hypothetical protein